MACGRQHRSQLCAGSHCMHMRCPRYYKPCMRPCAAQCVRTIPTHARKPAKNAASGARGRCELATASHPALGALCCAQPLRHHTQGGAGRHVSRGCAAAARRRRAAGRRRRRDGSGRHGRATRPGGALLRAAGALRLPAAAASVPWRPPLRRQAPCVRRAVRRRRAPAAHALPAPRARGGRCGSSGGGGGGGRAPPRALLQQRMPAQGACTPR